MASEPTTMQLIMSVFGGGVGGGIITKGFDYLSKRSKREAYTMGAVDHAVQTAMSSVTSQLERTEGRLEIAEAQHEDCERNLSKVTRRVDELERDHAKERAELKAEIDRLMAGPVAHTGALAPKDP